MALTHAGLSIPGVVRPHGMPAWNFDEVQISVFGLAGVGVLQGGFTSREFQIPIWIKNGYTQSQLFNFLNTLRDHMGTIGSLVQTGAVSTTYTDVEFLRFELGELIPPNPDHGWSVDATLFFRELRP